MGVVDRWILVLIYVLTVHCSSVAKSEVLCLRGYFWHELTNSCQKCPRGSYQPDRVTTDVTECSSCPGNFTTLITGATAKSYCVLDCSMGYQYNFTIKNCTACPIHQYRNESLQACYYCPSGQTTNETGSIQCVQAEVSPPPMTSLTVNVDVQFRIGKCENVDHMQAVLVANVLLLMRYRRRIYPDLCPTAACSNMVVTMINVCKGDVADVRLTIVGVNSRLKEEDTSLYRDADQVILGAFYDLTPLFDNMNILPCKSGEIMDLQGTCTRCRGGEFANHTSGQCQMCEKGSFAEQPADSCEKCPDGETTKGLGSQQPSDCFKDVELVIIVSASCGGVALISIIITIVVCLRRRRTSRHQQAGLKTYNQRPQKAQRAHSNEYTKTAHVHANSQPRSLTGSNPSKDTNQPTLYHIPQPEIDVDVMSCHYYLKLEPPDLDYLAPDYDTSSIDYSKNIDDNIYDEITSK